MMTQFLTSNNIQFIYQTIIYSMIRLGLIEADVDLKNFETGPNAWRNIFYIGLGLLGI